MLALLIGAVSLTYPQGPDQGLYYYMGREWLRGRVPYRDVLDHKLPFLYVLHAAIVGLFGEGVWGIRLADLLLVPFIGWLGARLASPRAKRIPSGAIGVAWLCTSVFYYGYFTFWDTGQCEIWYSTWCLAAVVLITRSPVLSRRRVALAGALLAAACLVKPTAAFFGAIAVVALLHRVRAENGNLRQQAIMVGITAFSSTAVVAITVAYFSAVGALPAMIDVVLGANSFYVKHEVGVHSSTQLVVEAKRVLFGFEYIELAYIGTTVTAFAIALRHRSRKIAVDYSWPLLFVAAALLTVFVQMKFYGYHWGTLVPAAAITGARLYNDLLNVTARRGRAWGAPVIMVLAAAVLLERAEARQGWWRSNRRAYDYFTGHMSRLEYARSFDVPSLYFFYGDADAIGTWLRSQLRKEDTVVVRGFEAHFYGICRCRYSGRFYWSSFLTEPTRAYRREAWLAEELAELDRHPPRFAVALAYAHEGVDSAEFFEARGYRRLTSISTPSFIVLERQD